MALRPRTPGARALLPATRCQSSGPLGALLSSPALDVRLIIALQVLQVSGCPAGLLRKSRAALGSERVRAALGSDGVRARAAGVTAGEDPTSFLGLGSLSGTTTTTTSALSRSWGRSRRPSVAERAPASR